MLAIAIGRGIRYFGEAFVAVWYGDQAVQFVKANAARVSIGLALAIIVLAVAWTMWRRRRGEDPSA